MTITIHQN